MLSSLKFVCKFLLWAKSSENKERRKLEIVERWEETSETIEDCARVLPVPGKATGIQGPRILGHVTPQGWIMVLSSRFHRYISFFTF